MILIFNYNDWLFATDIEINGNHVFAFGTHVMSCNELPLLIISQGLEIFFEEHQFRITAPSPNEGLMQNVMSHNGPSHPGNFL